MRSCSFLIVFFIGLNSYANNIDANKKTVREFYDLSFNKHKPVEAMNRYVGEKYIQHNPYVADGKEPFIKYFTEYYKQNPDAYVEIKRVIAEKNLVVLHLLSKQNKNDIGRAVVDIFRVENGKIVEHWDVAQPVIEKSVNNNTMF
ncbi:MAG: nuclear transport factor 2 family protein [Bdellovibrionales bacterium]|nr:nuclear transport factor 2 family protein [Bdellovibrionales bacterium]